MTTTTQPAATPSVDKGAKEIFEGITLFQRFFRQQTPVELTRDQQIQKFINDRGCNCGGGCDGCKYLIKDIFGG